MGVVTATAGLYASMGVEDKLGATLAVKRINETRGVDGHKIELIFEDDEGKNCRPCKRCRRGDGAFILFTLWEMASRPTGIHELHKQEQP